MWIEEYAFHIWHYTSKTLLDMELNALNRTKKRIDEQWYTKDYIYRKEIDEKIQIVKNRIDEILKAPSK